jgi:hypothetical protein
MELNAISFEVYDFQNVMLYATVAYFLHFYN